jgi:hypothetical protein
MDWASRRFLVWDCEYEYQGWGRRNRVDDCVLCTKVRVDLGEQ